MSQLFKKLLFLLLTLAALNYLLPGGTSGQSAATLESVIKTTTVTYQKGDGKSAVSETDDGTLESHYIEGTLSRFSEYQGNGAENQLILKRAKETSGEETSIDTKRAIIKFPNIIGSETNQIPTGAKINSATLKLVMNDLSALTAISTNAYRILESWTETESGYLKSPGWRNRTPAVNENDTTKLWTNLGADAPISSENVPVAEAVQIPNARGSVVSFDITKATQAWADGSPNNGIMLKLSEETPGGTLRLVSFYSSEWEEATLRPMLKVNYSYTVTIEIAPTPPVEPTPIPPTATPTPAPSPLPPTPIPATPPKTTPHIPSPKPITTPVPMACTQEAKQCPDGSYVSRTDKNCEFAKCPAIEPPAPAPKIEEQKPSIIANIFIIIQNRILDTWESIMRLFR
ncbi:MAG: DNRLRE domain-containing protein [bacterium]|nr:DNRLRE domain-containing protein [bacterium]